MDRPSSDAVITDLSATKLHERAFEAFCTGHRGRLALCEALRALAETRLYYDLGFPSVQAYAAAHYQMRRAETLECVRVATALDELTTVRDAFLQGAIGWSALKAVTRVATEETQEEWIGFARERGVERLLAEVRDARRAGRDTPRDASFGLPNLDQRLVLRMSRTDLAKVRSWLDAAAREVVEQTGAEEVSVEQALLYLCEKSRAGARAESDAAAGHVARDQVVYQSCPDCRRARAHTPEGSVEIDGSELERVTASADVEHVVIDGPTPHAMRRKVVARSGGRCANPRCDHRADHCHHIVFRAAGGRTELANEVAVCVTCHALIHAGLLSVTGSAEDGLRWQPMLRPRAAAESANADSPGTAARAAPRPGAPKLDQDALAGGLVRLGHSKTRSVRAIEASIASLPIDQRTEATVLRHALRLA